MCLKYLPRYVDPFSLQRFVPTSRKPRVPQLSPAPGRAAASPGPARCAVCTHFPSCTFPPAPGLPDGLCSPIALSSKSLRAGAGVRTPFVFTARKDPAGHMFRGHSGALGGFLAGGLLRGHPLRPRVLTAPRVHLGAGLLHDSAPSFEKLLGTWAAVPETSMRAPASPPGAVFGSLCSCSYRSL